MTDILVVEDEPAIAELLSLNLRHAGFQVQIARDGEAACRLVNEKLPKLVLLDWMLPGLSGIQLAQRWRADARTADMPIIMLTARAQEDDRVVGLDVGADDYVSKPFSNRELISRIKAVLRRRSPEVLDRPVTVAGLTLDPTTRRVALDGQDVKLGPTEFKLLHYFMTHPERVHSRAQLLDRVWGDHVYIEERTVDVHIKRLREALTSVQRSALIETVRGVGYRFLQQMPKTALTSVA